MKNYEKTWNEFWKPLLMNGKKLNLTQIKKELHDYHIVMGGGSKSLLCYNEWKIKQNFLSC